MNQRVWALPSLLGLFALLVLTGCPPHRLPPPRPPLSPDSPLPQPDPPSSPLPSSSPPVPLSSPEPHVEPDLVGTTHVLKKGETLYRIARAYEVDLGDLMEVNGIVDPKALHVGMELFVPGVSQSLEVAPLPVGAPPDPPVPSPKLAAPPFAWPAKGVLYSRFGVRNGQHHDGIDIAAPEGTAITAAAAGKVIFAGTQSGYGSLVILRHDNGLITLYAHASTLSVKEGAIVKAGDPIARIGRSGRTTGPHLHFEVREGTKPRNPLLFIR